MTRRPPALEGDRGEIARVVQVALDGVGEITPGEWLMRLRWMGESRRHALRELRALGHGRESRTVIAAGERYGVAGVAWWVAMGVGAALTISGAALLLPSRRSFGTTLGQQLGAAPWPMLLGACVLLALAVLQVPGVVRETQNARVLAAVVGGLTAIALVYNLLRVSEVVRQGEAAAWFGGAVVALGCCLVVAVRAGERPSRTRFHWRVEARAAARYGRWLVRHAPRTEDVRLTPSWAEQLHHQGIDLDGQVGRQAVELGPWLSLVAAFSDGELDLPIIRRPGGHVGS